MPISIASLHATPFTLGVPTGSKVNILGVGATAACIVASYEEQVGDGTGRNARPGKLVILDRTSLVERARVPVGYQPRQLAVDSIRNRAYVVNYGVQSIDGQLGYGLSMVDLNAPATEVRRIHTNTPAADIAIDPVRPLVYLADWQGRALRVINVETGEETGLIPVGPGPTGLVIDPTGTRAYVACTYLGGDAHANELAIVDLASGAVQHHPLATDRSQPTSICLDVARDRVYLGCRGGGGIKGRVAVHVASTGESLREIVTDQSVLDVDVDPDFGFVYAAVENSVVVIQPTASALGDAYQTSSRVMTTTFDRHGSQVLFGQVDTGMGGRLVVVPNTLDEPRAVAGGPLALTCRDERMNAFVVDEFGGLRTSTWSAADDWSPQWVQMPGPFLPGAPVSATSRGGGRWDAFVVGADGHLWAYSSIDDVPVAGSDLGGSFPPGAHLASLALNDSVSVFGIDVNGHVRSASFGDADHNTSVTNLLLGGGPFAPGSPLAAINRTNSHWDVFAIDLTGTVWTLPWDARGGLGQWRSLGKGPFSAGASIAAVARTANNLDVFVMGNNGEVWTAFWQTSHDWAGWISLGGSFDAGATVAAATRGGNHLDLFAVDGDKNILSAFWSGQWSGWEVRGGPVGRAFGGVAAGSKHVDELDIIWTSEYGAVRTAWFNPAQGGFSTQFGIDHRIPTDFIPYFKNVELADTLKGWVSLYTWRDGSYLWRGHIHNSGFDPRRFRIQASVISGGAGNLATVAFKRGHTDGTGSNPGGSVHRDNDWYEIGISPALQGEFKDLIISGNFVVDHSQTDVGLGGGLQSLVSNVLEFLGGGLLLGGGVPGLVLAAALGYDVLDLLGVDEVGVGGMVGVASAAGAAWILGPGVILPAFALGTLGAELLVHTRSLRVDELKALDRVFGPTLPDPERIILTDMQAPAGYKFVFPTAAGVLNGKHKILVNLGDAYDNPLTYTRNSDDAPGQLFMHEMTHAWQIEHAPSMVEWIPRAIADRIMDPGAIELPAPSATWGSYSLEEQASVVEHWYATYRNDLDSDAAQQDDYFPDIRDHIRQGVY